VNTKPAIWIQKFTPFKILRENFGLDTCAYTQKYCTNKQGSKLKCSLKYLRPRSDSQERIKPLEFKKYMNTNCKEL
jgi:hypothetical protein